MPGRMSKACRDLRIHVFVHLERSAPWSALHAEYPATENMQGTSFNELRETEVGKVSFRDPEKNKPSNRGVHLRRVVTLDTVAIRLCLAEDGVQRSGRSRCLPSTETPEPLISRNNQVSMPYW